MKIVIDSSSSQTPNASKKIFLVYCYRRERNINLGDVSFEKTDPKDPEYSRIIYFESISFARLFIRISDLERDINSNSDAAFKVDIYGPEDPGSKLKFADWSPRWGTYCFRPVTKLDFERLQVPVSWFKEKYDCQTSAKKLARILSIRHLIYIDYLKVI